MLDIRHNSINDGSCDRLILRLHIPVVGALVRGRSERQGTHQKYDEYHHNAHNREQYRTFYPLVRSSRFLLNHSNHLSFEANASGVCLNRRDQADRSA